MHVEASLSRSSSVDDLLPKQLLPLAGSAGYGTSDLAPAAAAAAAAAAEASAAISRGLPEEEEHELMQKAAEAYLMSVHLEAKALPTRVIAEDVPASNSNTGASSKGAIIGRSSMAPANKSKSRSSTHYVQRLLRLQQEQQQQSPPNAQWQSEALDFFRRVRAWLQEQRMLFQEQPQQMEGQQPRQLYLRCLEWQTDEWRLYCRRFPPTLPLLLHCDVRCCCLVLQLLLEDLEIQLENHRSQEKATPNALEASGTAQTEQPNSEAPPLKEEQSSGATSPNTAPCCQVPGIPTCLPQLFWLFAVLAMLDEVEALRFEVSYTLQRLRRRCIRLRTILLQHLGSTDTGRQDQQQGLNFLHAPMPFLSQLGSSGASDTKEDPAADLQHNHHQEEEKDQTHRQQQQPAGENRRESAKDDKLALRQQLAGVDILILIIRDFFGQK